MKPSPQWFRRNFAIAPEVLESEPNLPFVLIDIVKNEILKEGLLIMDGPYIEIQENMFSPVLDVKIKAAVGQKN